MQWPRRRELLPFRNSLELVGTTRTWLLFGSGRLGRSDGDPTDAAPEYGNDGASVTGASRIG